MELQVPKKISRFMAWSFDVMYRIEKQRRQGILKSQDTSSLEGLMCLVLEWLQQAIRCLKEGLKCFKESSSA